MFNLALCTTSGDEALAILLSQLAYPGCLFDLETKWGCSQAALSRCITELGDQVFTQWKHVLTLQPSFFMSEQIDCYSAPITAAGSPLEDMWGFVNGKVLAICHPSIHQQLAYNGYKKHHALKFQAVMTPDGLLGPVFGPVGGQRADGGVLAMSLLKEECQMHAHGTDGQQLFLYGDSAYGLSKVIILNIQCVGEELSDSEHEFNHLMSNLRQSVE